MTEEQQAEQSRVLAALLKENFRLAQANEVLRHAVQKALDHLSDFRDGPLAQMAHDLEQALLPGEKA